MCELGPQGFGDSHWELGWWRRYGESHAEGHGSRGAAEPRSRGENQNCDSLVHVLHDFRGKTFSALA